MAKAFQQQLIDAVNAKNGSLEHQLTVGDVNFGTVELYSPSGEDDNRNTKVVLTAKDESANFTGSKEFHYIRLVAESLIGVKTVTDATTDVANDVIVAALNADMITKGYVDDAFIAEELEIQKTDAGEGGFNYTVQVKEGHIKFQAGMIANYQYRVPAPQKVALDSLDGELEGFTAPSPKE
nr:MAG TPA: Putative virion structural protein [Caudoviricetes sp.]